MPILARPESGPVQCLVEAKSILFLFNTQHDCCTARCAATGTRRVVQERQLTDITEAVIEHQDVDIYIINIAAFHNAHLLRRILPRELTRPIPLYPDEIKREAFHHAQAAKLRTAHTQKRKQQSDAALAKRQEAAAAAATARQLADEAGALAAAAEGEQEGDEPPRQRRRVEGDSPDVSEDAQMVVDV
ncbi:hypothetical protein MKEN_01169400 [Mycena kentingensis (nom. inval.)]|nr:hypothetical protein MKEN_01169400 [Mycena kentingensis (nom. inval.)]